MIFYTNSSKKKLGLLRVKKLKLCRTYDKSPWGRVLARRSSQQPLTVEPRRVLTAVYSQGAREKQALKKVALVKQRLKRTYHGDRKL